MIETVTTYAARRRLKVGAEFREPPNRGADITVDNLVPEACTWLLVDSLVHHGQIVKVDVPVKMLFEAFEVHHIDDALALRILDNMGLSASVVLEGPHSTPKKRGPAKDTRRAQRELNPSRKGGPGTDRRTTKPQRAPKAPAKKTAAKPPASSLAKRHSTNTAVLIPMRTLDED